MCSTCSRAFGGWLAGCGAATAVISAVGQTILMMTSHGDVARLLYGIVVMLPSVGRGLHHHLSAHSNSHCDRRLVH
ncbi:MULTISPECIES: hypothetical protein [Bradyrhizobium]|uniref:Uncharacterized protein n=1 Tax=Bradyrhizobium elkanii TaxID=29448 RepID=A0A8I1YB62_BRAEL|nr:MULTISPECIES: hypothetical protein [Bradyrhizobium]MBP1296740.1 hypothetical protein [Bradyrhizobium elkanii]MCP1932453.1 hypothetical protein [Bradyrhizobium elkanii]MCS3479620.1 hypothetical protein [Bradyrhizobium elkanii]MCS3577008.1 hypothetical protein [Bradyrhizobium elkanii]MCS3719885.1 hypothetical protein [Bradyrhizobium elkanii]